MTVKKVIEAYMVDAKRHVQTTPNIGQILFMTDAKFSELREAFKANKSPIRALATNDAIYSWEAHKATHDEMTKFLQSKEIIERNVSAISLVITAYGKGIEIGVYPKDVDNAVRNKNIVRLLKSHPENEIMEM